MLIRDFFKKLTDFSAFAMKEIKYVQKLLNERLRKTLGFKTPKEKLDELLLRKKHESAKAKQKVNVMFNDSTITSDQIKRTDE